MEEQSMTPGEAGWYYDKQALLKTGVLVFELLGIIWGIIYLARGHRAALFLTLSLENRLINIGVKPFIIRYLRKN
jgi:hypothetical protein